MLSGPLGVGALGVGKKDDRRRSKKGKEGKGKGNRETREWETGGKGKLDNKRGKKWGKESKKLRSKKREEKGGDHHSEDTTVSLGHWVIAAGTMAVTSLAPATAGEDKEHALMALKKFSHDSTSRPVERTDARARGPSKQPASRQ